MVNGGVSGDTTVDALKRLPILLAQHQPKLVLTCIGGNDTLRQMPEAQTRANIVSICQQIKTTHAQNMLIAIPKFSVIGAAIGTLNDNPIYKEIAKEINIPLQEGAWSKVLSDERLKSDPIHANAKGYAYFVDLLAKSLQEVGLLNV